MLEVEHLSHAGLENGWLRAPYGQMEDRGIRRGSIREAINETIVAGFVAEVGATAIDEAGRLPPKADEGSIRRYRLTYYKARIVPEVGEPYYSAPTHDWRTSRAKPTRVTYRGGPKKRVPASNYATEPVAQMLPSSTITGTCPLGPPPQNAAIPHALAGASDSISATPIYILLPGAAGRGDPSPPPAPREIEAEPCAPERSANLLAENVIQNEASKAPPPAPAPSPAMPRGANSDSPARKQPKRRKSAVKSADPMKNSAMLAVMRMM